LDLRHSAHTPTLLSFFFSCYGHHLHLHSFPTRRSSDLAVWETKGFGGASGVFVIIGLSLLVFPKLALGLSGFETGVANPERPSRSEEHTSELQSRRDLVCRLLLEKKKKQEEKKRRKAKY